jgi:DNA-binding transcriptional LysR family regulator
MELYQLRSFVRVVRNGNLTRAAEELHLTQPAVSSQIKLLEEEIGDLLFERKGRGLVLTSAGRTLLTRAEQILALAEEARQEIASMTALEHGSISIGTNDSNCLHVLPEVIAAFKTEYPGVQIHLDNSHSSQVAQWVAEGRAEIGIVTLPILSRELLSDLLYEREDVLICPPDHPLAHQRAIRPADVAGYPLLMLHGGSVSHSRLTQLLTQVGAPLRQIMRVGSIEVIKRYVEIGLGISIVPSLNVAHELAESRLHARNLDWLPRHHVGVIRRRNGYLSPAVHAFLDRVRAHVYREAPGAQR